MYSFPPSGGRCWQHQWRDSGQHRDRGYDNGHCGLGGSSTGRWHSAAARFPPSFCTMHPPALTGRPGPGQAELLYLLWAQQSEWKPSHGRLRPQAWTDFCIFFFFRRQQYGSVLNSVFFFLLSSPSLVALEMDSEEENSETKSPISSFLSDGQSEDSLEPCHPSPDLTFPPGQSAVSACETSAKVNAASAFHQTPGLASQDLILWFTTSRKQLTQGLGCVHIPTLPQKSVCILLG